MKEKKIVFRCQGSHEIGWGHVKRCVALAQWLMGKYKVYFVTNQDETIEKYLAKCGCTLFKIGPKDTEEKALSTVLALQPDLVINDIQNTTLGYMQTLKNAYIKTINFDDTAVSAKMASALIDANRKERKSKEGRMFGAPYIVLDAVYPKLRKRKRLIHKHVREIVLSFGGSDPSDLTTGVLQALVPKISDRAHITVVVGPSCKKTKKEFAEEWRAHKNIKCIDKVDSLAPLLLDADLAFVSGGISMFESVCVGTPTIVIAQNKSQSKNARRMERKGAVFFLGEGSKISSKKITRKGLSLMESYDLRKKLSDTGLRTVDGEGIYRALERIEMCLWSGNKR